MNPTDPSRRVYTEEVAVMRNISLWRARRWLRLHGVAMRDAKRGYYIRLGDLLLLCGDAVAPETVAQRLDFGGELRAFARRVETLEREVRKIKSAARKRRAQRRAKNERLRRLAADRAT